jgi:hypothetical protein
LYPSTQPKGKVSKEKGVRIEGEKSENLDRKLKIK